MSNNKAFKALADPTRREILKMLAHGEKSAGELAERFDMSKPSISHHFSVLKEADLVTSRRDGQQIIYALNTTVMQDVVAWLWDMFGTTKKTRGGEAIPGESSARPRCNPDRGASSS